MCTRARTHTQWYEQHNIKHAPKAFFNLGVESMLNGLHSIT